MTKSGFKTFQQPFKISRLWMPGGGFEIAPGHRCEALNCRGLGSRRLVQMSRLESSLLRSKRRPNSDILSGSVLRRWLLKRGDHLACLPICPLSTLRRCPPLPAASQPRPVAASNPRRVAWLLCPHLQACSSSVTMNLNPVAPALLAVQA